jgi:hypothetical protein
VPIKYIAPAGLAGSSTARRLYMIRWNTRYTRVAMVLGALASLAIASGAGTRWV